MKVIAFLEHCKPLIYETRCQILDHALHSAAVLVATIVIYIDQEQVRNRTRRIHGHRWCAASGGRRKPYFHKSTCIRPLA